MLDDRVILVTGASGDLGRAICRRLTEAGGRVALSDLDPDTVSAACRETGGAHAVAFDVRSPEETVNAIRAVVDELGALDGVVAAAGLYQDTRVPDITDSEWDRILAVNVRGVFTTLQAALDVMTTRGSGSIVTLGSIAGQVGGVQSGAAYATSKAAVMGMTKALARHGGPFGVRVNCVNPGYIDSGMSLGISDADRARTVAATALGRAGTADEVAEAVLWLLSDASSFVTGAHIDVNGGLLMD